MVIEIFAKYIDGEQIAQFWEEAWVILNYVYLQDDSVDKIHSSKNLKTT